MSEEYFDYSDADSYGDEYEDYDDLYDDVEEEAGYFFLPIFEFGFDEERNLFKYDPDPFNFYTISYQKVIAETEMLSKLLSAWKKRSNGSLQVEFSDADYDNLELNLYQLEENIRIKLRSYSVRKLCEVLGGEEEVVQFSEKVDQTLVYLKKVLSCILARCLPMDLPYPASRSILSHLLREDGLHRIGFMNSNEEDELKEEKWTIYCLHIGVISFYRGLKMVMFSSYRTTESITEVSNSIRQSKDSIEKSFGDLKELIQEMDIDGNFG